MSGKLHLGCGGTLVYSYLVGGTGYRCTRCNKIYPRKGGYVTAKERSESGPKMPRTLKRVSDFIPDGAWGDRELLSLDDVLGKELVIEGLAEREGTYGKYFVIGCHLVDGGEPFVLTTGSQVLMQKLAAVRERNGFPVLAQFSKPARYYDVG